HSWNRCETNARSAPRTAVSSTKSPMAAILPPSGSGCPSHFRSHRSVGPVTHRLLGLLLAVLIVGSACGDKKDASQQTTGPYAVGVRTVTFIDNSRALDPRNKQPDAPRRRLVTNLWYPAEGAPSDTEVADAKPAKGPFPLIVFSHGRSVEPHQYAASFRIWARAGYVVAGVRHPLTVRGLPFGAVTEDIVNEPADQTFVITKLGAADSSLVDIHHVAV